MQDKGPGKNWRSMEFWQNTGEIPLLGAYTLDYFSIEKLIAQISHRKLDHMSELTFIFTQAQLRFYYDFYSFFHR